MPEVTPEIQARLDAIPEMQLSAISSTTELPEVVDNSQNIFMRPIFEQLSNECGQAAGVAYTYTYEINRIRNLPANNQIYEENWYPTHYTWNFFNNGQASGSWYFDGWDIIIENGCPDVYTWGGMAVSNVKWMSGYENYHLAMHNRIDSYKYCDISTPEGLEDFKHWINDHNEGSEIGGLGCFASYLAGFSFDELPPENLSYAGLTVMSDWEF